MHKFHLLAAASALSMIAVAAPAHAEDGGWYGRVSIGSSDFQVSGLEFEPGLTYGAGIGTSVGPVRVEAGVDRISGQLDAGFVTLRKWL